MVTLKLKSKQWIEDDTGKIIIGEGRMKILETIDKTGSINQTSKIMKMSYKGVWSKVKATEKNLKVRLVETDRKTGSRLTQKGQELMHKYRLLKKRCLEMDDKNFEIIFDKMEITEEDIT